MNADGTEACAVAESHRIDSVLCYHSRTQLHRTLFDTLAGRALILGIAIKAIAFLLGSISQPDSTAHDIIDTIGDVCLLGGGVVVLYRLSSVIRGRLLWRVRRKLILSYVFMGVVPALLIITFFLLAGLLLFFNVSSYLMQTRMRALEDEARFTVQASAIDLQSASTPADARLRLARMQAAAEKKYPGTSLVVVPAPAHCVDGSVSNVPLGGVTSGPWTHQPAPSTIPEWVPCEGYGGLVAYRVGEQTQVVVRAVGRPFDEAERYAVVMDVPVGSEVAHRFRDDTGIDILGLTTLTSSNGLIPEVEGETPAGREFGFGVMLPTGGVNTAPDATATTWNLLRRPLNWVSLLDYTVWRTGEAGAVMASIRMSVADLYNRISETPIRTFGSFSFGQLLLLGVAMVALSFLVIQSIALGMGFGLARSITGSVHELFAGTERVRRGDFTHKIAIRSRDQLGELAESFNSMTASIEDLLRQKAEKERLEEELRIARQIQMSLLPTGPLHIPGLMISGHCEPAREVGGDYYDLLPLGEGRFALLIADVAGKGTSAALYMAELKGLILSLSQLHRSPKQLLIDANRIISQHLSERSFITMTYAVIDTQNWTLTHARAGHCPLIYKPAAHVGGPARVMAPDGLVLGLRLDGGEMFARLLEEITIPLTPGDMIVLFTDGITEAMNADDDCFGETRLAAIVDEHAGSTPDIVRERILREVHAFAGPSAQHDDMTMLLLKVQGS